jgi:hypothetical protein
MAMSILYPALHEKLMRTEQFVHELSRTVPAGLPR